MEDFITITDAALDFLKKSVAEEKCSGVRINVVSGGCQGMTYELSFVKDAADPADLTLEKDGVFIYIAAKATIFVAGMTVDYQKTPMGGSIIFENPNAKNRCGCGKSFCLDGGNTEERCSSNCCS